MSDLKAAAQQALEFCEFLWREVLLNDWAEGQREATEAALRAALAEPDDEPTYCPTCGEEDGGTTCGMPDCGLRCGAEPVQEPDDGVCDGLRGGLCVHQDPSQCKPERDCPASPHPSALRQRRNKSTT